VYIVGACIGGVGTHVEGQYSPFYRVRSFADGIQDVGFNTFVINGKVWASIIDKDGNVITNEKQITFANQFFYIFSVAPIKISVLFFYRRVFGVSTAFRKVTSGMFALVGAWTVAFFFVRFLSPSPLPSHSDNV
jgi:hypothetical protein